MDQYKAASDRIEQTLNEVLPTLEDHEEGDLLVEWMLIAYVDNADQEKESAYPMLYSNGNMPTYRARGLLATALNDLSD